MRKITISILVPVYNAERYLDECLSSLCQQEIDNFEIICINDGSTDNSLSIIEKYLDQNNNIRLVDKKNTGYGESMNRGIRLARGKYIGILEPDDFVNKNMFKTLVNLADKYGADIARGNYCFYNGDDNINKYHAILEDEVGKIIKPINNTHIFYEPPAIWSSIYNKEFLIKNKILFLETPGAAYQDTSFNFKVLACAEKIVFTDQANIYYRTDNINSSVKDQKKIFYVRKEYNEIEKFIDNLPENKKLLKIAQATKFGAYQWNLNRLTIKNGKKFIKIMKNEFKVAKQKGLIEKKYFPYKYWIQLKLILFLPPMVYLFFIKIMRRVLFKDR